MNKEKIALTESGREKARHLVRAHRLWEAYLAHQIGLDAGQIHEDAEKYEHLLTEEMLEEVDKTLGYPTQDPHGSPIPPKPGLPRFSLLQLNLEEAGKVALQQPEEQVVNRLWHAGLLPGVDFILKKKESDFVELQQAEKIIRIPLELARITELVNEGSRGG
jgi:Mn-dependent DtxR family transcriptional regulator